MKTTQIFISLLLVTFSLSAGAQSSTVLKGNEITESALIEALTPPPPKMRSFGPDMHSRPAPKLASQAILITFETNSIQLTPQAKHDLDVVGHALNSEQLSQFDFLVEGHADTRGKPAWNQRLSEGRAKSVRQYLVQNHNIAQERLRPIGKGDSEPLNEKDPAAAENRRVTFVTISD